MDARSAVDFTKSKSFRYSFELSFEHPFNAAARAAFHKHFKLTIFHTNWLDKHLFDHRLMIFEVIEEVLKDRLEDAKKQWDRRLIFVVIAPEVKQLKRVEARVYPVSAI